MASRTIWKVTTTVFISRCLKNARRWSPLRRAFDCVAWGVLAACLLAFAAPALAQPPATEITQLRLERTEEGVLLSANIAFELPTVIDDALDKGIPMFFVAEAVLFRDRWYWYDKQVAAAARHMRLSYQPLTRRWRLVVSPTPIGNSNEMLADSSTPSSERSRRSWVISAGGWANAGAASASRQAARMPQAAQSKAWRSGLQLRAFFKQREIKTVVVTFQIVRDAIDLCPRLGH